jgi:hypothetical protein
MPLRLTEQQVQRYRDEGYVSGLPILSAAECAAIRARIEAFEAARPADAAWAFDIKANLLFDWVYDIGADRRMLDIAQDLLGPDLLNTNTVFRIKEPGSSTNYGWHQDAARIQVEPLFAIGFLAITECTPENGGLSVIPGSHDRIWPFDLVSNPDGQARRRVARTRNVDVARAVDLTLAAGEAVFFSGNLIHGSGANRAAGRRIAILTDYTAASARQSVGRGSGQLVRGSDRWCHFGHETVPVGSCAPESVLARRKILRTYPENPLMGPLGPDGVIEFPDEPAPASVPSTSIN